MSEVIGEVVSVPSLVQFEFQQISGGDKVAFGNFVITEDKGQELVGIIIDICILNPNMATFPKPKRLPDSIAVKSVFPDLIEQYPTIITVYVLGYFNKGVPKQDIPLRPPNIYQKIYLLENEKIKQFHLSKDENGQEKPIMHYLYRLESLDRKEFSDAIIKILNEKIQHLFGIEIVPKRGII